MAHFGSRSLLNLSQCHPDLQRVALDAIREFDFAVICGERGRAEQEFAHERGTSNAHYGQSPHNFSPALAFDAVPWPLDWTDVRSFDQMAFAIEEAARRQDVAVTWGGTFKHLKDRPHFELTGWRDLATAGRGPQRP